VQHKLSAYPGGSNLPVHEVECLQNGIKILYYYYGADWRAMARRLICLTGPFSGGSLIAAREQQQSLIKITF
jgi:hypothetical protein